MSGCQHCGQGAITKDANGPVCPDCWDEGYYETANPMTDQTEAPERIWLDWEGPHEADHSLQLETYSFDCKSQKEYTRADLSDAKIAEAEQRGYAIAMDAERKDADARIAELEVKLAKATVVQCWTSGEPPKYLRSEWFIAKTKHKDRVVIRSLHDQHSYDYTTADGTYMRAENVIAWMQFPDSNYISYVEGGDVAKDAIARIEELEAELDTMKTGGIIEVAVRNPSVSDYMTHWEGRAELAEAKLAKATDGLRECEEEIDDYVRQEYPGEHPVQARYRARDFAANPARAALAELKETDQ